MAAGGGGGAVCRAAARARPPGRAGAAGAAGERGRLREAAQAAAGAREALGRPLSLAEKTLFGRLWGGSSASGSLNPPPSGPGRLRLRPDHVLLPDAAAPLAMLQLLSAGVTRAAVPATIHCDSLRPGGLPAAAAGPLSEGGGEEAEPPSGAPASGPEGADEGGMEHDRELVQFLGSAGAKLGLGMWQPGGGAASQVLLENHAAPGMLVVGPDAHASAAGGLGALAVCVGGPDAVDVLAGQPWELAAAPPVIGVRLLGKLHGWAAPKDIFLRLSALLPAGGGAAGAVLEYFGPGVADLSCAGRAAICHMGSEVGAVASIFPHDARTGEYLAATGRPDAAAAAEEFSDLLRPDEGCGYSRVVEVDLSDLEPHIGGPGPLSLGQARPLSEVVEALEALGYSTELQAGLIGSGASSSYEDMARSASIARQALKAELSSQIPFAIAPGSERVRAAISRDGQLKRLEQLGGVTRESGDEPWGRCGAEEVRAGEGGGSIITSCSGISAGDLDGNLRTQAFVASPELVAAFTLAGDLSFNPERDSLVGADGSEITLNPPSGDEFPGRGFDSASSDAFYQPPLESAAAASAPDPALLPGSECLQPLPALSAWDGRDLSGLKVLLKAEDGCGADQIVPRDREGRRHRAHLAKASEVLFSGVAAVGDGLSRGHVVHPGNGEVAPAAQAARELQDAGVVWVVVAGDGFGEGGPCELAALVPRYRGGVAVVAKSFGGLHEANMKRHGLLPLVFSDASDFESVDAGDELSLSGLEGLGSGKPLMLAGTKADGSSYSFEVRHSFASHEAEWFRAGGFLNLLQAAA